MQAVAAGLSGCAGNSAPCWKMRMASEIRRLGRDRRFPVICEAALSKRRRRPLTVLDEEAK